MSFIMVNPIGSFLPGKPGAAMPRKSLLGLLALALLLAVLVSIPLAATVFAQSPEDGESAPSSEEETPPPPTPTPTPDPKDDEEEPGPRIPIFPTPGPTRDIKIERTEASVTEGTNVVFKLTASIAAVSHIEIDVDVTEVGDFLTGTIPDSIGLGPGLTVAWLILETEDDDVVEDNGSVTGTITKGSGYTGYNMGSPSSATTVVTS